jgi:hypothetical protein
MSERQVGGESRKTGTAMKRRGLLAGAAALVAGIAAKQQSAPVLAATAMLIADVPGFVNNSVRDQTSLGGSIPDGRTILVADARDSIGNVFGFYGFGSGAYAGVGGAGEDHGVGVSGVATGSASKGVSGTTDSGYGVYGEATGTLGWGIYGKGGWYAVRGEASSTDPTSTGVYGYGASTGVLGTTSGNYGVYGSGGTYGVVGTAATGVYGNGFTAGGEPTTGVLGRSSGAGGIGVLGQCDTGGGIGVRGLSNLGIGVSGASNGNAGVFGTTTKAGFSGLAGIVSTAGTAAFAGTATVPTAFAGFFTGDVFVNGNFTVNDPTRKHGTIAHPDGSLRLLYSMESPESWLEDFGTGQLAGGQATVTLDPDFAAVSHTQDYLVFLTPRDAGCKGLAVAAQSANGFVVQELHGGAGAAAFYWRVVAKPKSEHKATRMAKFVIPEIKVPQPPAMPNVSVPPVPESPPQATPPSRPATSAITSAPQQGGTLGGTQPTVQPVPPSR